MNAIQRLADDSVNDGMSLSLKHVINTFERVRIKLGGETTLTLNQIIEILKEQNKS